MPVFGLENAYGYGCALAVWLIDKGSVTNFVSMVINGSNLVRIRYKSYQEGAFYYGNSKRAITTDYLISKTNKELGKSVDATYGVKGVAAEWGDLSGGAGQIVTPFSGDILKKIGILKEK